MCAGKTYKEVWNVAIEPISSVMTFQAQGSVVQKPQAPAQAEKPENSSASGTAAVEYVDRTTSVVENRPRTSSNTPTSISTSARRNTRPARRLDIPR